MRDPMASMLAMNVARSSALRTPTATKEWSI
jgi:hypothetical protein